jgi:hypothetical protein
MATTNSYGASYSANLSISAFRGVVISNNQGITYGATAVVPDGFAQIDAASGDITSIRLLFDGGTQKCSLTGAPVTAGDTLFAGALGRVSSSGTVTVGRAASNVSVNGDIVTFIPLR